MGISVKYMKLKLILDSISDEIIEVLDYLKIKKHFIGISLVQLL